MTRDVVCGMTVEEETTEWKSQHEAKTYYFCSPTCKQKFDDDPERFVGSA
jgi:Cu+-exporting ATPase